MNIENLRYLVFKGREDMTTRQIADAIGEFTRLEKYLHPESVDVNKSMSETDEFYGDWLTCPNCQGTATIYGNNYCTHCGVKLEYND